MKYLKVPKNPEITKIPFQDEAGQFLLNPLKLKDNPFWEKSKRIGEKTLIIGATTFSLQRQRAAHALRSDQFTVKAIRCPNSAGAAQNFFEGGRTQSQKWGSSD